MKVKQLISLLGGLVLLVIGTQARALMLTPDDMIAGTAYGPSNCEPGCIYEVFGLTADPALELLYKADYGEVFDEGTYAGWYHTAFIGTEADPEPIGADIRQAGAGYITCPECYLAVKDGSASPGYYFYNLGAWDGMEEINLRDFWPQNGAISHVSIWGRNVTSVPEPAPLTMMGLGLLVMALAARRRRLK